MAMRRGEYAPWPAMGNFLIILSQALMAGLFIAEELLLKERHLPPLRLVAWEGSLGVAFNAALLLLTLLLPGPDAGALENPVHATLQLFHSPLIFVAVSVMALSLLAFNLAGVYITKFQTATHRACVDATRQVLVWAHALAVGWEAFNRTELLGYALLLLGTVLHFLYIDMGLGSQGGRRYYYAYSSKLGNSCVSFHVGTFMLAACFPLWAYRRFGMQPAFYVTLAFAVLWVIYDAALLLPTHDHINQLLAHAYMGIDAEKAGLAGTQGWTPEAWEGMYKRPKPDEDPAAAGRNGAACTTTVVSAAAAVM